MRTTANLFFLIMLIIQITGCAVLQPSPSKNTAVKELVSNAEKQAFSGEYGQASASLERALRIEPRNPALWQELARVRLNQGLYQQAESLAAKSNSLSSDNRRLRKNNWLLIAEARSQSGDRQGAQKALERAKRE